MNPEPAAAPVPSIAEQIAARGITHLCHATKIENLPSIADHRLISRKRLETSGLDYAPNDSARHDGMLDHISTTISVPNTWFLRWKDARPAAWTVLLIAAEPELARETACFTTTNAAAARVEAESGAEAFARLFGDLAGRSRSSRRHPACPTDMQAEVLIFGYVRPSHLTGLVVAPELLDSPGLELVRQFTASEGIPVFVSSDYFATTALNAIVDGGALPVVECVDV